MGPAGNFSILLRLALLVNTKSQNFKNQLNRYQERYKAEIDKLIAEEKQNKYRINKVIEQIETDLKEINNHQNKIRNLWKTN